MNERLRIRILEAMGKERRPMHLSADEISSPETVVLEFFDIYSISDIRIFLDYWKDQALQSPSVDKNDIESLYSHVIRVIEAAWLIFVKTKQL